MSLGTSRRAPTDAGLSKLNSMLGRIATRDNAALPSRGAPDRRGSARPGSVDVLGPIARCNRVDVARYEHVPGGRSDRGTVVLPRKEVIQPQLPLRLPCYDFTPVTSPTFDGSLPCGLGHRLRVLLTPVV